MGITIQIASRVPGLPAPAALRRWAGAALRHASASHAAHAGDATIVVRVVNRAEGRRLNFAYRGKDGATNVLTFAYAPADAHRRIEADVVLCAQVVAAEAREQGKPVAHHYAHLTVHGVLHAAGFDHENRADAQRMEARELAILGKLGIPDPYR